MFSQIISSLAAPQSIRNYRSIKQVKRTTLHQQKQPLDSANMRTGENAWESRNQGLMLNELHLLCISSTKSSLFRFKVFKLGTAEMWCDTCLFWLYIWNSRVYLTIVHFGSRFIIDKCSITIDLTQTRFIRLVHHNMLMKIECFCNIKLLYY